MLIHLSAQEIEIARNLADGLLILLLLLKIGRHCCLISERENIIFACFKTGALKYLWAEPLISAFWPRHSLLEINSRMGRPAV